MAKLDPSLERQARANPTITLRVILRVQGDMDARQGQLEEYGFIITRRLRIIHGYAASAPGHTLLRVTDEEWIISIEPDAEMRIMQ